MNRGFNEETHGHNRKHGQRSGDLYQGKRPRAYAAWVNMRQRCRNPNLPDFKNWGMRGITYCHRWEEFANFFADMGEPGPGMSLDRIDNMGDYLPENCRWASKAEQGLNKRNVIRYEHNGQALTLGEWSRETGIGRVTLLKRLQRGISIEVALSTAKYLKVNR